MDIAKTQVLDVELKKYYPLVIRNDHAEIIVKSNFSIERIGKKEDVSALAKNTKVVNGLVRIIYEMALEIERLRKSQKLRNETNKL